MGLSILPNARRAITISPCSVWRGFQYRLSLLRDLPLPAARGEVGLQAKRSNPAEGASPHSEPGRRGPLTQPSPRVRGEGASCRRVIHL